MIKYIFRQNSIEILMPCATLVKMAFFINPLGLFQRGMQILKNWYGGQLGASLDSGSGTKSPHPYCLRQIYLTLAYWQLFYSGKQAILSLSTHVHFHPPPHMSKYSNI